MSILEHLFLNGEYPERARLLSGLKLEQVTVVPSWTTHSIYEELWHVVAYQQYVIAQEGDPNGDRFPQDAPKDEQVWHDLVKKFLEGARTASEIGDDPERMAFEIEPGLTMADELQCVAIHNAYHFGKIVAIRMEMGAWPPEEVTEASL